MENSALETDTEQASSLAGNQLVLLQQGWRLEQGERGETGPIARAHGKGTSCWPPSHSLPSALWLAEGGFHHPPASWLLRARSPIVSAYTGCFIHRAQILWLLVWLCCLITFASIYKVNLCIILGLFLPHRTAVTEVFSSAKCPWKLLHTLDKHALSIWLT